LSRVWVFRGRLNSRHQLPAGIKARQARTPLHIVQLESALSALQLTLASEQSGKPLDANLSSGN